MWVLRNFHDNEEKCFKLVEGHIYKVGRKDSDLVLGGNDSSISRYHGEISLVSKDGEDFVQVIDKGSRYGTYINNNIQPIDFNKKSSDNTNNKMEPNTEALLKAGDKIRFGLQWHIWFVYKYTYVVSSSKLDPSLTSEVKSSLQEMNIPFQSDWTPTCTHLTMSGIVVTPKVVSTLASNKHIVTPAFWSDLARVLGSGSGWYPKEEDYLPPVVELAAKYENVSFLPNPTRRVLFEGLKFVALSQQQMKYLEQCVTLAGGTIVNMNKDRLTKKELLDEKTIVLIKSSLHVESQQTQVNSVVDRLKELFAKTKKRLVDESELGYAIMFASRASACNPYVPFEPPQAESQSTPSSRDTQDSNVMSVSMITTQKTPKLTGKKRERSPSSSSERESKRIHSTALAPNTQTDSEVSHSSEKREVKETLELDHSGEMMTFRDTNVIEEQSEMEVQSEVYELEDVHDKQEVSRDLGNSNTTNKATRRLNDTETSTQRKSRAKRFENDSSEDELENLFSKCQSVIKNITVTKTTNKENNDIEKQNAANNDKGRTSVRDSNRINATDSNTEMSDRSGKSKGFDETDDSVFNKPTSSVKSWLTKAKGNVKDTSDTVAKERENGAMLGRKNTPSKARSNTKSNNITNRSLHADSDEEEEVFGTCARGANSTFGTSRLNSTRGNNSLWNRTQTGVTAAPAFSVDPDDDDDNVFGAPKLERKAFADTSHLHTMKSTLGRLHTETSPGESMDSRTTMGSERGRVGGRKRLMEEEEGENYRTDQERREILSLQDRGLLREDEPEDYKPPDSNCCVISVPFLLKKIPISPQLTNRKIFKKQPLPGKVNKARMAPITFYPVFGSVLDEIKLESCIGV